MNSEISYRYKTVGASGIVTLKENSISSSVAWSGGKASFEIPFEHIYPHPTRQVRRTRMFASSCLATIPLCAIATLAIVDREAHNWNVPAGILLYVGALVAIYVGWRYREDDWVVFSCSDAHRAIAFAKPGPDAERFDTFAAEVERRLRELR